MIFVCWQRMTIWGLGAFSRGGIFSCSTARILGAAPFFVAQRLRGKMQQNQIEGE